MNMNTKLRNKSIAASNKMLERYGHDCTIVISSTYPTPIAAKVLFSKYSLATEGGTLVISTNYKLLVKAVSLPSVIIPTSKIIVNGVELAAISAKKLTPDGVNPIMWEIEAAGSPIPDDVNSIDTPTVISPANNTSDYTSTAGPSHWIISCTGSTPSTHGDASFTSSEWQIATDDAFTTIISTGTVSGVVYSSGDVMLRNTHYYVRVRYNSSVGTTAWSSANLFSLDSLTPAGPHINTPSITSTNNTVGVLEQFRSPDYLTQWVLQASPRLYNPILTASSYSSIDAGAFASITFQIATDSGFTTLVLNHTQTTGYGYDPTTSENFLVESCYVDDNFILSPDTTYYGRVRYTSVDPYTSDWSETFTFKTPT